MKSLNIVVLVKQVIDTYSAVKTTLNVDGTVNRDALPAIINPDDLNALGLAFKIRNMAGAGSVIVVSMGPPRAADSIREAIWRGADSGVLLSDRKFAGADTLATSYTLAQAVKKLNADIVLCGSQSIDGDTGHVGPQTAFNLGFSQVTYTDDIISFSYVDDQMQITATRHSDSGIELIKVVGPVLFTASCSERKCGQKNVRRMMSYKNRGIVTMNAADLAADIELLGLNGSPTKVLKSEKYEVKERVNKRYTNSCEDIDIVLNSLKNNNLID